jgi:hypothetical protein
MPLEIRSLISPRGGMLSVALHPMVLAAYAKYASGHGIRDALILNF